MSQKNSLKKHGFIFILFTTLLFHFTYSDSINYYDGVKTEGKDIDTKKQYEVIITDASPSYIHITLTSLDDSEDPENLGNNEILSFSSNDPECLTGREQLAQSYRGAVEMWLKKEQYSNKIFYLVVQCPDPTKKCNYEFTMESSEYILLNRNTQLSYYTTKKNEEVIFHIPKKDLKTSTIYNDYAEIWFKGSENIQMTLEYYKGTEAQVINSQKHYVNGAIFTFKEDIYEYPEDESTESYYKLIINAHEGDYITVGNKAIDNKGYVTEKNILFPNTGETTGYLKKDILEKECFYLVKPNIAKNDDYFFISGNFYNKYFKISYYKEDGSKYQEEQVTKINYSKKFLYQDILNGDVNSFCVELSSPSLYISEEAIFTFEIVDHAIYTPQSAGRRYNRLMKSGSIATFSVFGTKFEKFLHYNTRIISGVPRMFFHQCKTYPICDYSEEDLINLKNDIKGPHYVNKLYSYTFEDTTYKESPISSTQNLIIVECFKDNNNINDDQQNFCNFESYVTDDTQQIILDEGEHFYSHIHKLETDKYLVNLDGYNSAYKVFIDLQIISGDVFIDINAPSPYTYNKYEVSNKIFYSIHVNKEQGPFEDITFQVNAKNNSYYLVSYLIIKDSSEESLHYLDTGMNYLEAIDKTIGKQTSIFFTNNQKYKRFPFLVNFYSLNCQFEISRPGKKLDVIDSFAQEIVLPDDDYYSSEFYVYELTILSIDSSKYEGDFCFFYTSGLEIDKTTESDKKGVGRHIVISENIPQRIVFESGINNIKFLFPHSSPDKNVNINFNLVDLANYEIKMYFEYREPSSEYTVSRTQHIFLQNDEPDWKKGCIYSDNNLCNIIIDITLKDITFDETPMIEISAKPIPAFATYVTKSLMRSDYVCGDQWLYLYSDLSYQDEGDIVFNFLKGSGDFYGKIVEKNLTIPEENAEWRGLYRFPKSEEESISSNVDLKKLFFERKDTNKCIKGCYLLISVRANMITEWKAEYRYIPFSIIIHSRNNVDVPLIQINTDEFVIGNVNNNHQDIYEFYSLILNNDGEEVSIDWQTEAACIYINIGDKRPHIDDYHFVHCSPGYDSFFTMKKKDILAKYGDSSRTTLKDLKIIIGTFTKAIASVYTTVYVMKVNLRKPEINIYTVNSNQKVLCPTEKTKDNKNLCLFIVIYEDLDLLQNLVIYPKTEANNAKVLIHADYIGYAKYEQWDTNYLNNNIPSEQSTFTNYYNGKEYLFIPNGDYESHLYVAVYTDVPSTIELIATFSKFDDGIVPNPSTTEAITFKKEFFILKFETDNDIAISLVSLQGKSKIYWEFEKENEYYLGGREDRLAIVLTSDMCNKKECNLIVNNLEPVPEEENPDEPGFIFLVSYNIRAYGLPELIFEELKYGKSTEIIYRDSRFPIMLYCQLPDKESSVNLYFDFREMKSDNQKNIIYDNSIDVNAMILSTEDIFKFKADPTYIKIDPNTVKGVFSSAITVGNAYLTEEEIKKFDKVTGIPWLFIYLTKTSDISDKFTRLTMEAAVAKANNDIYTSINNYQHGKLGIDEKNVYKLKGDTIKKFLRVQFSSNSNIINYSIRKTNDNDYTHNDTSIKIVKNEWVNGRGLLTIELENGEDIYLTIFKNKEISYDEMYLTNYVFKYVCVEKMEDYKEYRVEDDLIKFDKNKKTITFNKIKDVKDYKNVIYFVKLIKKDNYLSNENIDTIAITQSSGQSIKYENLTSENDELVIELKDISPNTVYYYNVIAQINEERIVEYISYYSEGTINIDDNDNTDKKSDDSEEKEGSNHTVVIILIVMVIAFVIIVTVLLVCLFRIKKERNTLLLDKVKQTSFKSQGKIDNDSFVK